MSNVLYSNAAGSLMYSMMCIRPNLFYAISVISCYMDNSGKDHWEAVKWVLCYVKGTTSKGLMFDRDKAANYDVP